MATGLATTDRSEKSSPALIVRGRRYQLFKRGDEIGSPWWFRVQVKGKRRAFSTSTGDLALAKNRAKIGIVNALDGKEVPEDAPRKAGKKGVPTLEAILQHLEAGHLDVRKKTAALYERSLILVVETVKGCSKDQVRKMTLDVLTADLARTYQALKQGLPRAEKTTLTAGNTTANSHLRFARSVFSKQRLLDFQEAGFVIPDELRGFLTVPYLEEESHRYSDDPIPQEAINKMDKALPKLKKENPVGWAVHVMVRLMGLRDSEIEAGHTHWLSTQKVKGKEMMEMRIIKRVGEKAPKRTEGVVAVPDELVPFMKERLAEAAALGESVPLVPAATPTERYNRIYREHNEWLRQFIPDRVKGAHELRKHFGALWATKTGSLYVAAQMLRVSLVVAEYHYSALLNRPKALSLKDYQLDKPKKKAAKKAVKRAQYKEL